MPASKTPSVFAAWTLDEVSKALAETKHDLADSNQQFIDGDHWQDGDGWVGPMPQSSEEGYAESLAALERAFISRNVIKEVVERHASALLGQEPRFRMVLRRELEVDEDGNVEEPTDAERALIAEAETLLTEWWNERKAHQQMLDALQVALWAEQVPLRLYIPRGLLADAETGANGGKQVSAENARAAIAMIYLDVPGPGEAGLVVDVDTQREAGVFVEEIDNKKRGELVFLDPTDVVPGSGEDEPEHAMTMVRHIGEGEDTAFPLDLGGRLLYHAIKVPLLITEQVQSLQKAFNLAQSMIPRNAVTGGFLERLLLNAQMPGTWEKDETTGVKRFVPGNYDVGAGTTNFLRGIEYTDKDGKTVLKDPSAVFRPPSEVQPAVDAVDAEYAALLTEVKQGHILLTSEATPSGQSRIQARVDFIGSILRSRSAVEPAGRWLCEALLAFAEAIIGEPGKWTGELRAEFLPRVDVGPPSVDERKQNLAEVDSGALSVETAMERNGVVDVDAELASIAARDQAQVDTTQARATIVETLTRSGASLGTAGTLAGFDDEAVALLTADSEMEEPEDDPNGDGNGDEPADAPPAA